MSRYISQSENNTEQNTAGHTEAGYRNVTWFDNSFKILLVTQRLDIEMWHDLTTPFNIACARATFDYAKNKTESITRGQLFIQN